MFEKSHTPDVNRFEGYALTEGSVDVMASILSFQQKNSVECFDYLL